MFFDRIFINILYTLIKQDCYFYWIKLRFLEFKNDWQIKKIDEIANILGGGTPKTDVKEYWNGNINWFTPSEIGTKKYVECSERKITSCGLKNSSAKLIPKNSILLSSRYSVILSSTPPLGE